MKFEDAKSLQYLKRIASLRARSKIFSATEIRMRPQCLGMNSEVIFG